MYMKSNDTELAFSFKKIFKINLKILIINISE